MKRAITGILTVVIIIATLLVAIPFVMSSQTVRNGITAKIEALTGSKVSFQGEPSLSFSPFLGFELSNLELIDPTRPQADTPLLKVEKVKAEINLLPALIGNIEITEYHFLRPSILVKTYSNGTKNWDFDKSGFKKNLQIATDNRANQTDKTLPTISIGDLQLKDGVLIYEDEIAGTNETITGIDGRLIWKDTDSELELTGSGIWRGEGITTSMRIDNPIEILSGGESSTSVELNSQPLTFTFNGQANMLANLFVKGDLTASSPSISRLTEALEINMGEFSSLENWRVAGKFEATANNSNLSDATFSIGESNATGVIRVSTNELGQTKLDGTLAFENINLANNFAAIDISNLAKQQSNLLEDLNVDLRISSQSINLNSFTIEKIAAAIIVDNEGWTFDIGDASAFNGKLVAKLGERLIEDKRQAFLDISATDVDTQPISDLLGEKLIDLSGKTSFIANIRTNKLQAGILNSGLNGSFSGTFTSGVITGINLTDLIEKAPEANQSEIEGFNKTASTNFQEMNVKLFLNNGIAAFSKSNIQSDGIKIQVIGDINTYEGKIDLQLQETTEDGPKENRVIIKGSTTAPSVTIQNGPPSLN